MNRVKKKKLLFNRKISIFQPLLKQMSLLRINFFCYPIADELLFKGKISADLPFDETISILPSNP